MFDSMSAPDAMAVMCVATKISVNPARMFIARNFEAAPPRNSDGELQAQQAGYLGSSQLRLRHGIRMSTAAPSIFTPLKLDGDTYCDGAFFANNPSAVALAQAKRLWPGVELECLVSIGSGAFAENENKDEAYGWASIGKQLVESATDTQRPHEALEMFLPPAKYFRFNPTMVNIPIDETDPNVLQVLFVFSPQAKLGQSVERLPLSCREIHFQEHKEVAREYFEDKANKERLRALARIIKGS